MNPQLKQSWIAALRSGHYRQGRGHLRERSITGYVSHCAMGVLFDLIATPTQWHRLIRCTSDAGVADYVLGYMPAEICAEIGVSDAQQALIASLNDSGRTFEQIADVIEQDFEDELRLRATTQRLVGGRFFAEPPVLMMKPAPDWNALAGYTMAKPYVLSMQPMTIAFT